MPCTSGDFVCDCDNNAFEACRSLGWLDEWPHVPADYLVRLLIVFWHQLASDFCRIVRMLSVAYVVIRIFLVSADYSEVVTKCGLNEECYLGRNVQLRQRKCNYYADKCDVDAVVGDGRVMMMCLFISCLELRRFHDVRTVVVQELKSLVLQS